MSTPIHGIRHELRHYCTRVAAFMHGVLFRDTSNIISTAFAKSQIPPPQQSQWTTPNSAAKGTVCESVSRWLILEVHCFLCSIVIYRFSISINTTPAVFRTRAFPARLIVRRGLSHTNKLKTPYIGIAVSPDEPPTLMCP